MTFVGNPDLDTAFETGAGRVYRSFGGGPYWLAPRSCALAGEPGRPDFKLLIARSLGAPRASLEAQLKADYDLDAALSELRRSQPGSVLAPLLLTNWSYRLATADGLPEFVHESLLPSTLASNGLGSARLVASLSVECALFLEEALRQAGGTLPGVAEADLRGVAARLPVVVRFRASELLTPLLALADGAGQLTLAALAGFFAREPTDLPLEMSGAIDPALRSLLAETLADRVVARFGRYVPGQASGLEPAVLLQQDSAGEMDIRWSLSQPTLVSRRVALPLDLLAQVRSAASRLGLDQFVRRKTLSALPAFGRSTVTALCNLPRDRRGLEALGVTLTFPARSPHRPQAKRYALQFQAPEDLARVEVALSSGEALDYSYATFAVLADAQGVRELHGPGRMHSGPMLRLSPDDFPVSLLLIEMTLSLAQLAFVEAHCHYEQDGLRYTVPATLDSGCLALCVAVPSDSATQIRVVLRARDGSGALELGPFETSRLHLDLTSLPSYGPQETSIRVEFDDDGPAVYALELLPLGEIDAPENISQRLFTRAEPSGSFGWFSHWPFGCGFRYRLRGDGEAAHAWREHLSAQGPLLVRASELRQPAAHRELIAASALPRSPEARRVQRAPSLEAASGGAASPALCPEEMPSDELFYTPAGDATRKLYLPRYKLDVEMVSGQRRHRVALVEEAGAATLTVGLALQPADSLGEAARDAAELPHEIVVALEYLIAPPAGIRKTLVFDEVARGGPLVTVRLALASLQERDEVFMALTESARMARLVVSRAIHVAVPIPRKISPGPLHQLPLDAQLLRASFGDRLTLASTALPQVVVAQPLLTAASSSNLAARAITRPTVRAVASQPEGRRAEALSVAAPLASATMLASPTLRPYPVGAAGALVNRVRPIDAGVGTLAAAAPIKPLIGSRFVLELPTPAIDFYGLAQNGTATSFRLGVNNWSEFPPELLARAPDLPPCGSVLVASRTWLDVYDADTEARIHGFGALYSPAALADLSFELPAGLPAPKRIYVRLLDRRTKSERRSASIACGATQPADAPKRELRTALDQVVTPTPFMFSPALHGYMFQGLTPPAGGSQLIRFRLPYGGSFYSYFQDAVRREIVYYLPDRLKLARRREAPFTPLATIRTVLQQDSADASVLFSYLIAPYTSAKRLAGARALLLADPRFGDARLEFQPLATSEARLFLDRPAQFGIVREVRASAAMALQGGMVDALSLSVPDFILLWDAMTLDSAAAYTGRLEVSIPHQDNELIPFVASMRDLAGDLFDYRVLAEPDGTLRVALTNAIESPLDVHTLDCTIEIGNARVRGVIHGGVLPRTGMPPGDSVELAITPEAPLASDGEACLSFDLDGVTVRPDVESIWSAVLDQSTADYYSEVTVKAIPSLFEPLPDRPEDSILEVLVLFEGGPTAVLRATRLEATVRVPYAVEDVVLRRTVEPRYRYTVTVVRQGRREELPEPRQQTAPLFWISVDR